MKRHQLYEIDLDKRTAFCVVCGYTEIFIPNTRKRTNPKPKCITRARELKANRQEEKYILKEEKQLLPTWRPQHSLSEINVVKMTAICAVCGPTDIWKNTDKDKLRFICATRWRDYMRQYKRVHYVGRSSNPHALSEVDEEKGTAMCAKCGHVKIEIKYTNKKIMRRCINRSKELIETRKNQKMNKDTKRGKP
jgi:hypothetical protein